MFKIDQPNYVDGAGPDLTLIPTANLPRFIENATLQCEDKGTIHWFALEQCPAQGGLSWLWTLAVNVTIDVVSPSYTFELSTPSADMRLSTTSVTGNVGVQGDDTTYNANLFVSLVEHRPGYVAFVFTPTEAIPIPSVPRDLSFSLNFY